MYTGNLVALALNIFGGFFAKGTFLNITEHRTVFL